MNFIACIILLELNKNINNLIYTVGTSLELNEPPKIVFGCRANTKEFRLSNGAPELQYLGNTLV